MPLSEDQLRTALGEAMVQVVELQHEVRALKGITPADEETLEKCRESNRTLASLSEARMQTIRAQDKEIKELRFSNEEHEKSYKAHQEEIEAADTQIKFLQKRIREGDPK